MERAENTPWAEIIDALAAKRRKNMHLSRLDHLKGDREERLYHLGKYKAYDDAIKIIKKHEL